ncbi:hypothetical protein ABVT39_020258 [Epinephelus coioides]
MSSTTPKRKLMAPNQKVIQYKATSGFILQIFIKSQELKSQISISDLMTYPLTLTPYSISTIDGFFAKTNKAKGMNHMIKDAENAQLPSPSQCALSHSSFYRRDVPQTMKTISEHTFKSLPAAAETVFSTDTYVDRVYSPKSVETDRRGCGERFMVSGLNVHRPAGWNGFLTNDENKKAFTHLLLNHWSSPDMMEDILRRPVIFIEAVINCQHNIFDIGGRLININQLAEDYSNEHISALLALHAFTGADCTSAFKGKGKVRPMKILNQNSKFIQIFAEVGNSWELDERILSGVEEFTCRLYGFSHRIKKVDEAREIKHMRRVSFQVCIWKRAHEHYPEIPSPLDHGFHINTETGKLEPLWFEGDVIPKALVDVLAEEETDEDDLADEIHTIMDDDEEEEENDD